MSGTGVFKHEAKGKLTTTLELYKATGRINIMQQRGPIQAVSRS
jgi:hypothetical protein